MSIELAHLTGNRSQFFAPSYEGQFHGGGENLKIRINGYLQRDFDHAHPLSLIKRMDISYSKNWWLFHQAGLPVVPTIRKNPKEDYFVYVTDLTACGAGIYGKGAWNIVNNHVPHINDRGIRRNSLLTDRHFLIKTSPTNIKALREECLAWADLASKNKLYLPWDDPFDLIVYPNGVHQLICQDLETGGLRPNRKKMASCSPHVKKLMRLPVSEANIKISENFLRYLGSVRSKLLETQQFMVE